MKGIDILQSEYAKTGYFIYLYERSTRVFIGKIDFFFWPIFGEYASFLAEQYSVYRFDHPTWAKWNNPFTAMFSMKGIHPDTSKKGLIADHIFGSLVFLKDKNAVYEYLRDSGKSVDELFL